MASRDDLRKAYSRYGREAPVSGVDEYLDHASAKPPRHGSHRNQHACGHEASRHKPGANPATRGAGTADSLRVTAGAFVFRRTGLPGLLHKCGGQSPEAAKYGLTIADVQQAVESGIGGMNVAENVEGRSRYPINVRYQRDFRDNVGELSRVLIATPSGAQIPIGEVAKISFSRGPAMIRDEDGQLTGYVYIDLNTTDYGGFVDQASQMLPQKLQLPAGYTYQWSGEYEFQLRAKERMKIILPVVFFVIFLLLYMVFHNLTEAMVLIFPTFYAMTGGLILQWLLGYNFSVAVWVGYIALFGIAVETGVVIVVYLHESLDKRIASGRPLRHEDIEAAVIEGAVHRLRPKLMTVSAVLASLIPILWASGIGSDVMKPIAAPMVGGMITSTIHVLILVPVVFVLMNERALRHGTLRPEPAEYR